MGKKNEMTDSEMTQAFEEYIRGIVRDEMAKYELEAERARQGVLEEDIDDDRPSS